VHQRLAAAAALLWLTACDAASPPEAVVSPETSRSPTDEEGRPVNPAARAAAEAIAQAVRDPDAYARARRLATLLPTLGPEGVHGVKETLGDPAVNPSAGEIELLVRFWASHEPAEATRWAVHESPSGYRWSAILASLEEWAAADPQAALGAAQKWEAEPSVREPVQVALIRGWFERDPAELFRHIRQLDAGFARQRALSTYIRLLLQRQGSEAAIRWAESIPEDDPVFKREVYRQVAVGLPNFDVDAALRWCEAHCDGPHGKDLRGIIAMRWAQIGGGRAAIDWLSRAPESAERDGALPTVFAEWAALDADESSAWLTARSAAGDAEPWLAAFFPVQAVATMRTSPARAIEWASRVEDEKIRERLLVRVARAWRWQDEAAAEAWLRESPLSEEARERARKLPPVHDRLPKE
jgi:hypothetical protein